MAAKKKPDIIVAQPGQSILDCTINEINRRMGAGTLTWLGEEGPRFRVEAIPTKSMALNYALGIGGLPRGRVVEIFGPECVGKTNLALGAVACCQQLGEKAAYVDPECGLDILGARVQGVDVNRLLYSQPSSGEKALAVVEALVKTGEIAMIVVDSVAALTPQAELDGEMGDQHVGLQARMMGQAMRKLTNLISRNKVCVVFINQIREKVGVIYGSPETTPGGRALKFYASIRLDVRRGEILKAGNDAYGHNLTVKVVKNKLAPPHKVATFSVIYNQGIDFAQELTEVGPMLGIVQRSGAWYTILDPTNPTKPELDINQKPIKINGVALLREYLSTNPDYMQVLFERTQAVMKQKMLGVPVIDEVETEFDEPAAPADLTVPLPPMIGEVTPELPPPPNPPEGSF